MRLFPRIRLPRIKQLVRKLRRSKRYITVARSVVALELLVCFGVLFFLFTGRRATFIDSLGRRADLVALGLSLALFGLAHKLLKRHVVPVIERYFSPAPYNERRILFDLGQEARSATNIDQLYKLILNSIGDAVEAENVSIFVREDATGDYVCRFSRSSLLEPSDQRSAAADHPQVPRLPRDAFVVRRVNSLSDPLVIGEADFEAWDKAFKSSPPALREARQKERETLRQINSSLLLQIRIKNQLVGILSLGVRRGGHPYSANDKEMLMSVAGELAFVIENSRLVERMVAEEQLRRELALAAEVQQGLFPAHPPISQTVEMAGYCQPARGIGGDYYDFLSFDNGQIGVAIADVAGKGISAALVMSIVQASLRSQVMSRSAEAQMNSSLSELVSTINRLLCRSTGAATYVTFFYAQIDERTHQLAYVNAGHNPPLFLRLSQAPSPKEINDGSVTPRQAPQANNGRDKKGYRTLTAGGPVIGMFESCAYEQGLLEIQSGDLLVAYTDGVTEALNRAGEEFGEERLQQVILGAAHMSADGVRESLVQRVQFWCADAPQHDDLTFIVLKMR